MTFSFPLIRHLDLITKYYFVQTVQIILIMTKKCHSKTLVFPYLILQINVYQRSSHRPVWQKVS